MQTLLVLGSFLAVAMPCWAQGSVNTPSDQRQCDLQKIAVSLRDKDPEALKEVENRWIRAYGERDTQSLDCILADDFEIGSMPDDKLGINNKRHVMDWIGGKAPSVNKVEQFDVKIYCEAAVVRGIYSVRTPHGKLISRFQFTDVFVYRANGWKALSREIAQLPVTIDLRDR